MRIRYILIVVVLLTLAFGVGRLSAGTTGSPDSPGGPASDAAKMYTLEDIYQRLDSGAAGTQNTFTEPAAGPGTTMHTLNDIMDKAPVADNTNGATTAEVLTGKTYWSLRTSGGTWGPQTGTAAEGNDVSGPDGEKTFNIPDGFYSGSKTCTANDAQLVAGNIKSGVDIFGVTGSYAGTICTGDATTADVLYPKTFSNSSSTGPTGELYGGCTCSGTLNGTRWCDNGDGTVTDLTTCLVWLQKADWGEQKKWEDCTGHDDAHTRAGILKAGTADAELSDGSVEGDWRLPTKTELAGLVNGTPQLRCTSGSCNLYAFTGVQSGLYWSSTTYAGSSSNAWFVSLSFGYVNYGVKTGASYVWPVRGGQ